MMNGTTISQPRWPIRLDARPFLIAISGVVVLILTALLLGVILMSFRAPPAGGGHYTLNGYRDVFQDPFTYKVFLNTALFSIMTVAVALFVAVPLAWVVERTDLPGKSLVYVLMSLGVLMPGFLTAMGWTFIAHPRIGLLNTLLMDLFGFERGPINIGTIPGMAFVQGLGLAAVSFILVAPLYRAMDGSLEEAGAVHGMRIVRRLWSITVPLTLPGIVAASIYILILAMSAFEVPAFLGLANKIFTFSTYIYIQANPHEELPRYDMMGATSMLMIFVALLLTWGYFRILKASHHRYAVVTGRGYRPKLFELGSRWLWVWCFIGLYFLLAKILPLLLLVYISLVPYPQPFSLASFSEFSLEHYRLFLGSKLARQAALNTGLLVVVVPTVCVTISFILSWIVIRSRVAGSYLFDVAAFLPHAVPSIIFAVAAAYVALFYLKDLLPLYGTIVLLMAVYTLVYISLATRGFNGALLQIHRELEEAAQVSGLRTGRVILSILVPLLAPAIVNLWLWIALLSFRELTMASMLVKSGNVTLPMVVWGYWSGGQMSGAAAAALVSIALMVPLIILYWLFGRRVQAVSVAP